MKQFTFFQISSVVAFLVNAAISLLVWARYNAPFDCIPEAIHCQRDRAPLLYLVAILASLAVFLVVAAFAKGRVGRVVVIALGILLLLVDAYSLIRVF